MEFEHVGQHCAVSSCKQRDFLPFTCDICKEAFCGDHRTYTAHGCSGAFSKDRTSIDCPLCKKSILLTKADNPDEIWESHFNNNCNPASSAAVSKVKVCARPGCRTVLSISNTVICGKCNKTVCLAHKILEEHDCIAAPGGRSNVNSKRLAALSGSSSAPTAKKTSSNNNTSGAAGMTFGTNKIAAKSSGKSASSASQSSIRATADRRKKPGSDGISSTVGATASTTVPSVVDSNLGQGGPTESFLCHICSRRFTDPVALVSHMDTAHPSGAGLPAQTSTRSSASPGAGGDLGAEVCPQCQQRFHSVDELVIHFESTHGEASGRSAERVTRKDKDSNSNCEIS